MNYKLANELSKAFWRSVHKTTAFGFEMFHLTDKAPQDFHLAPALRELNGIMYDTVAPGNPIVFRPVHKFDTEPTTEPQSGMVSSFEKGITIQATSYHGTILVEGVKPNVPEADYVHGYLTTLFPFGHLLKSPEFTFMFKYHDGDITYTVARSKTTGGYLGEIQNLPVKQAKWNQFNSSKELEAFQMAADALIVWPEGAQPYVWSRQ